MSLRSPCWASSLPPPSSGLHAADTLRARAANQDGPASDLDAALGVPHRPNAVPDDTEPGPAMRLSGKGYTHEEHDVVNAAIAEYFTDDKQRQRRLIDFASEEYSRLDPAGILRAEGVRLYVLDGLLRRIEEIAIERGITSPSTLADVVDHPGRVRGNAYIDASRVTMIAQKDGAWRAQWARHLLAHIHNSTSHEPAVQAIAPLPLITDLPIRLRTGDPVLTPDGRHGTVTAFEILPTGHPEVTVAIGVTTVTYHFPSSQRIKLRHAQPPRSVTTHELRRAGSVRGAAADVQQTTAALIEAALDRLTQLITEPELVDLLREYTVLTEITPDTLRGIIASQPSLQRHAKLRPDITTAPAHIKTDTTTLAELGQALRDILDKAAVKADAPMTRRALLDRFRATLADDDSRRQTVVLETVHQAVATDPQLGAHPQLRIATSSDPDWVQSRRALAVAFLDMQHAPITTGELFQLMQRQPGFENVTYTDVARSDMYSYDRIKMHPMLKRMASVRGTSAAAAAAVRKAKELELLEQQSAPIGVTQLHALLVQQPGHAHWTQKDVTNDTRRDARLRAHTNLRKRTTNTVQAKSTLTRSADSLDDLEQELKIPSVHGLSRQERYTLELTLDGLRHNGETEIHELLPDTQQELERVITARVPEELRQPIVSNLDRVVIHTVQQPELRQHSLYFFDSLGDMPLSTPIAILRQWDEDEQRWHLYMTEDYYERLRADPLWFASDLAHELMEANGSTHAEAALLARYFVPEGATIATSHQFALDQLAAEDRWEMLEELLEEPRTPADDDQRAYEAHFRGYVEQRLAVHAAVGITPPTATRVFAALGVTAPISRHRGFRAGDIIARWVNGACEFLQAESHTHPEATSDFDRVFIDLEDETILHLMHDHVVDNSTIGLFARAADMIAYRLGEVPPGHGPTASLRGRLLHRIATDEGPVISDMLDEVAFEDAAPAAPVARDATPLANMIHFLTTRTWDVDAELWALRMRMRVVDDMEEPVSARADRTGIEVTIHHGVTDPGVIVRGILNTLSLSERHRRNLERELADLTGEPLEPDVDIFLSDADIEALAGGADVAARATDFSDIREQLPENSVLVVRLDELVNDPGWVRTLEGLYRAEAFLPQGGNIRLVIANPYVSGGGDAAGQTQAVLRALDAQRGTQLAAHFDAMVSTVISEWSSIVQVTSAATLGRVLKFEGIPRPSLVITAHEYVRADRPEDVRALVSAWDEPSQDVSQTVLVPLTPFTRTPVSGEAAEGGSALWLSSRELKPALLVVAAAAVTEREGLTTAIEVAKRDYPIRHVRIVAPADERPDDPVVIYVSQEPVTASAQLDQQLNRRQQHLLSTAG